MRRCTCGGLIPEGVEACPNCAAGPAKTTKRLLVAAAVGLAIVTSQCAPPAQAAYGIPTCELADGGITTDTSQCGK